MDEFDFDDLIKQACAITLEQGFHLPTVMVNGSRGDGVVVVADMPNTHDERVRALFVIGYQVSREPIGQLQNVVLILESWYSQAKPGQTELTVRPSEDPQRREMLLFDRYIVREGRHVMVSRQMIRNRRGKLVRFRTMIDSRLHPEYSFESPLMQAFVSGFVAGRADQLPPTRGGRG